MFMSLKSSKASLNTIRFRFPRTGCRELSVLSSLRNQPKPYQQLKLEKCVNVPPAVLLDVISDVALYEKFLPFCQESTVTEQDANGKPSRAILKIGWKGIEESYESKVTVTADSVTAESLTHHLFAHLYSKWTVAGIPHRKDASLVSLDLQYQFKSELYNTILKSFGSTFSEGMARSFENRAKTVYNEKLNSVENLQ